MASGAKVLGGVSVGAGVAAANMTTAQAHPKVHPPAADAQAVLATGCGRANWLDGPQMRAGDLPSGHRAAVSGAGIRSNEPGSAVAMSVT